MLFPLQAPSGMEVGHVQLRVAWAEHMAWPPTEGSGSFSVMTFSLSPQALPRASRGSCLGACEHRLGFPLGESGVSGSSVSFPCSLARPWASLPAPTPVPSLPSGPMSPSGSSRAGRIPSRRFGAIVPSSAGSPWLPHLAGALRCALSPPCLSPNVECALSLLFKFVFLVFACVSFGTKEEGRCTLQCGAKQRESRAERETGHKPKEGNGRQFCRRVFGIQYSVAISK